MSVLRNRALLIMAAAVVVSNLGNWIAMQAIVAMLIFEQGGSIGQSAILYLCGVGPMFVLAPVAGAVVDRFDRKRIMVASELLAAFSVSCMIFATRVEYLYVLLVVTSLASTVMQPARSSVIPDVIAPVDLPRANAFMLQVSSITRISSPMIGAAIVAAVSAQTALIIDVVALAGSALILCFLPPLVRRRARPVASTQTGSESLGLVLRTLMQRVPLVKLVLPFLVLLSCLIVASDISTSVYVRDIMLGDITTKGMLGAALGVGMGLASLLLLLLPGERDVERTYLTGLALIIFLPATLSFGDLYGDPTVAKISVLLGFFLGGAGVGLSNVMAETLLQRITPPQWLGRVGGAIQSVVTGGQLAGMFLTPLLLPSVVSFGVYFGIGAIVLSLLLVGTALVVRRAPRMSSPAGNEVAVGD